MTEHGGEFILINVYVPNAPTANCVGGVGKERPRLAYKLRFLNALLEKMDQLVASGKQVCVFVCVCEGGQRKDVLADPRSGVCSHGRSAGRGCCRACLIQTTA